MPRGSGLTSPTLLEDNDHPQIANSRQAVAPFIGNVTPPYCLRLVSKATHRLSLTPIGTCNLWLRLSHIRAQCSAPIVLATSLPEGERGVVVV